ncbi:recombinase family protein [Fictibacillus sp. 18YEL24]|uniref:recombinase family protein n=1 Tax=Fictibacillus sp. 18YEL24 TaxID=2745875 RepID=UPI0018CD477B|nr:recombinase family protein [Fictibacillus sp. 18YEL24]MBH0169304.1 recombinase family protein [Fictibacillus sp. 18YEL24]
MIYGYARVSSTDQKLDTQTEQLKSFGVEEIISEKISGISENKKLDLLLKNLKPFDTLVATRMDRLGRNTVQLLQLVEELSEKEIYLVILNLGIDTRTPTGKFFLTVMAGFSELERTMIKEKQRAGIELAKKKGKYRGRTKQYHMNHKGIQHAIELYIERNKTVKEICEITKVSKASLYRELKIRCVLNGPKKDPYNKEETRLNTEVT